MLIELEVNLGKIPNEEKLSLVLREKGGERFMIFSIDQTLLEEILIPLFDLTTDRPATHAAWAKTAFEARTVLEQFVINMMNDKKQLLCSLHFRQGSHRWKVDCMPSDGIALALHLDAPIMCRASLFTVLSAGNEGTVTSVSAQEFLSTRAPAKKEVEDGNGDDVEEKLRVFSASHSDIPKA